MKLKRLILSHFRAFEQISIDFENRVTTIIGKNGAGKTSILDAIAICMTHFTGELLSSREGYKIDAWFTQDDISNDEDVGLCEIYLENFQIPQFSDFRIGVKKSRNEKGLEYNKFPEDTIKEIKSMLKEEGISSLPIIAYYNVNRTFFNKNEKIKNGQNENDKVYNELLFAYERSLSLNMPSFDLFESWFKNQVIEENAYKVKNNSLEAELPSLKFFRQTLHTFLNELEPEIFGEVSTINRSNVLPDFNQEFNTSLVIQKEDKEVLLNQLSDGERMVIGLVAETARRLFIANKKDPELGYGIVLIDEIELHLHPFWQKNIVSAFTRTFPNINLIFTTHSPLVLSGMRKESIKVFVDAVEIPNSELPDIYTATSDEVLNKIMHSPDRFDVFNEERRELDRLFNDLEFDQAYTKLQELKQEINSKPEWLTEYEQRISFARS